MRLFFIVLFIAFSTWSFSQGNLQFNQVINMSYNYNFLNTGQKQTVGSVTVPVGKVWKIESGSIHGEYSANNYPYPLETSLFLGDFCVISMSSGNYGSPVNYPIWLSAGVYSVVMNVNNNGGNLKCALSVIEFNIIP